MEKKYFIVSALILVITIGVGIYVFQSKLGKEINITKGGVEMTEKAKDNEFIIPKDERCETLDNSAKVINMALKKGDISLCKCIEKDDQKAIDSCNALLEETSIYQRAAEENDVNICKEIKSEEGAKNCEENVLAKIEYSKK
ncbi:MAG: hypothetical protein UR66_C0016G0022 [Candidatus Moranbacteria bacterium GW2011_GWE1_35_17]|nr:MAG: hypothetical protein UR66_C0016G0022 [Candidatus Moranbacteria bacterium GW2011_GWE1_35_17]KKP69421.1 MAG: hypothetical protein UR65_C0050G0002 [Candidatus Moranbacteria bacterium GW2011_GWE2_35_164]KKP82482.1 MAG: hypothetical protein UR82_C0038G0008 [Candidatus Moranbacteria bacterium GW2011_GWF1_35_5]KKP84326.1 MAG: hypothetical protein UR83_C0023G0016 [Candidatus Moranbacteria bacterium GW2011_GWF2_35_54]